MMKKLLVVLMVLGFTGVVPAADRFAGTWKLNASQSKFAAGMEVKENTVVVAEQAGTLSVTANVVNAAGPISVKYTFPAKGGAVTYTEGQPPSGATSVTKRVDANTIDSTSTLNGKEVGTTHAVLSADGQTLTRVVKGVDAQGKAFTSTEVYTRQ